MANKHLSEDEIQYTIDVKTAKAQQEIHKLETSQLLFVTKTSSDFSR